MKKFRRSPIAIACYVLSAAFMAYFLTIVVSTIVTINQYYAAYDMSATFSEVAGYLFQNGLAPLTAVITAFMAGLIYDEVRKLNPDNWATEEEIFEAKEAKRIAREAKQIAKGEAAAAAAAAGAADQDSAEEIKPEFAAAVAESADEAAGETEIISDEAEDVAAETAGETAEDAAETVPETEETVEAADEDAEEAAEPEHTDFYAEVAEES